MKHFTWIGAAAAGAIVAASYWTIRQPDLAERPRADAPVAIARPFFMPQAPRNPFAPIEIIEPILVLPEWEVAPTPELVSDIRMGSALPIAVREALSPRPEAGRELRPWMDYAPEDEDLSATRRLAWAKLSTQDPVFAMSQATFEETAEPPLLETSKK